MRTKLIIILILLLIILGGTVSISIHFNSNDTAQIVELATYVTNGNISELEKGLEKRIDINTNVYGHKPFMWPGDTLLHLAARNNQVEIIKLLIKKGADITETNLYGFTPLMDAAVRNHHETVDRLIKNGADVNAIAVYRGSRRSVLSVVKNEKIKKLLLKHGATMEGKMTLQNYAIILLEGVRKIF